MIGRKKTKKSVKSKKTVRKSVKGSGRKKIRAVFSGDSIVSGSKEARDLYGNRLFGEYIQKKVSYAFAEALYLVDKGKMEVFVNSRKLGFNELVDKCNRIDKKAKIKYIAYSDLRDNGYLPKTALKFGADFRVYDKGDKPGKAHARWILYVVSEEQEMTWHDFSAKNRVAHSTKKNLLVGVVDSEGDVTYYEVRWMKV